MQILNMDKPSVRKVVGAGVFLLLVPGSFLFLLGYLVYKTREKFR